MTSEQRRTLTENIIPPPCPGSLRPAILGMLVIVVVCLLVATSSAYHASTEEHTGKQYKVVIISPPYTGHLHPLCVLGNTLLKRGHNVTFVTSEGGAKRSASMFKGDFLTYRDPYDEHVYNDLVHKLSVASVWEVGYYTGLLASGFDEVLIREVFPVLNSSSHRPDLIVTDILVKAGPAVADALQVPMILFFPFAIGAGVVDASGTALYYPSFLSAIPDVTTSTFFQRVVNVVFRVLIAPLMDYTMTKPYNEIRNMLQLDPVPSSLAVCRGVMKISTVPPGLDYTRPLDPLTVLVGPLIPDEYPQLSNRLKQWLDEKDDIVYVSFGTMLKFNQQRADVVIRTFQSLPNLRVLWSIPKDLQHLALHANSSRFLIETFVPQLAVLNHPSVLFFVSHAGANSIMETLYFGKPVVAAPVNLDQFDVAARLASSGAGICVYPSALDEEFSLKVHEMLNNTATYTKQAKKIAKIFRSYKSKQRVVDVLEAVMEVGVDHLITPSPPFLVKYSIDTLSFIIVVSATPIFVICSIVYKKCHKHPLDLGRKKKKL